MFFPSIPKSISLPPIWTSPLRQSGFSSFSVSLLLLLLFYIFLFKNSWNNLFDLFSPTLLPSCSSPSSHPLPHSLLVSLRWSHFQYVHAGFLLCTSSFRQQRLRREKDAATAGHTPTWRTQPSQCCEHEQWHHVHPGCVRGGFRIQVWEEHSCCLSRLFLLINQSSLT